MANTLEIQISAAIGEFQKQMGQASSAMRDAARQMGADFGAVGAGAEKAGGGISSLSEILREHKSEHVQTARAVASFTREFDTLLGKGSEVGAMLGGLAGGLASGSVLVVGMEVAKFGFEMFTKAQNESKKSAEEYLKTLNTMTAAFDKYDAAVARASATEKTFLEVTKKPGEELVKKKRELADEEEKLAKLQKDRNSVLADPNAVVDTASLGTASIAKADDNIKKLQARISTLRNEIDIARALKEEADKNVEGANAPAAVHTGELSDEKKRAQWEKDFGPDGAVVKLAQEAQNKLQAYRQRSADYADKVNEKEREDWEKDFGPDGTVAKDAIKAQAKINEYQQRSAAYAEKVAEEQTTQQVHQWIRLGDTISRSFAQGFTQAIFHAKSFEDGLMSVFDAIEKAFERLIEQMVEKLMASIILSFLGTLIGGPVGAAVGAQGGAGIVSLDVGTPYVPHDQIALIHRGERVVTASDNAALSAGATLGAPGAGSGGGGDTFHINISGVIDGDHLMRVVRSREFRTALGEARRNGEIT